MVGVVCFTGFPHCKMSLSAHSVILLLHSNLSLSAVKQCNRGLRRLLPRADERIGGLINARAFAVTAVPLTGRFFAALISQNYFFRR
jgi:hypothetical protein